MNKAVVTLVVDRGMSWRAQTPGTSWCSAGGTLRIWNIRPLVTGPLRYLVWTLPGELSRARWKENIFRVAGKPWGTPSRAVGGDWGEGGLGFPAETTAPMTWTSGRKWMDGLLTSQV